MSHRQGKSGPDLRDALARCDVNALVNAMPYARFLGLQIREDPVHGRLYVMPYRDAHIGNPAKPALHGGTVAALLEIGMQLEALIGQAQMRLPQPVDFTIDYWRSAGPVDCYVGARLIRSGRQMARVQAECWQADRNRPIAFARAAFLLRTPTRGAEEPDLD